MFKYSIVIPAYNAENYIHHALDSLKRQTYKNFEVLVTNNGSRDNTEAVVRQYMLDNPGLPISLASQENKGIGSARNNAISRATGEYLAFLDADDVWYPNKLEAINKFLVQNPRTGLLSHRVYRTTMEGRRKVYPNSRPKDPCYESLLLKGNTLCLSATVASRNLVMRLGGFVEDPKYLGAEDYELWLRLAKTGSEFGFINEFLGEYLKSKYCLSSDIPLHMKSVLNVIEYNKSLILSEYSQNLPKTAKRIRRRRKEIVLSAVCKLYLKKDFIAANQILRNLYTFINAGYL